MHYALRGARFLRPPTAAELAPSVYNIYQFSIVRPLSNLLLRVVHGVSCSVSCIYSSTYYLHLWQLNQAPCLLWQWVLLHLYRRYVLVVQILIVSACTICRSRREVRQDCRGHHSTRAAYAAKKCTVNPIKMLTFSLVSPRNRSTADIDREVFGFGFGVFSGVFLTRDHARNRPTFSMKKRTTDRAIFIFDVTTLPRGQEGGDI